MSRAIDRVRRCTDMNGVRAAVDALDDRLVPLLVERMGYMAEAAAIKRSAADVRDEGRIAAIVARVRDRALAEGGCPDFMEAVYRDLMERCIAREAQLFAAREGA